MAQVKFVVERVGREVSVTFYNTAESAAIFKRLWDRGGFYEWGRTNLALPKETKLIDDSTTLFNAKTDSYEFSLSALYDALISLPPPNVTLSHIITCDSITMAKKAFHDITRILDDIMRQIAVAVRDLSQIADEAHTITVDF